MVITYIGFFVAALIIVWAVIEISHRFYKRRKIHARVMHTWVPLHPPSAEGTENDVQSDLPQVDSHSRAQQNGHYSESKKL